MQKILFIFFRVQRVPLQNRFWETMASGLDSTGITTSQNNSVFGDECVYSYSFVHGF